MTQVAVLAGSAFSETENPLLRCVSSGPYLRETPGTGHPGLTEWLCGNRHWK